MRLGDICFITDRVLCRISLAEAVETALDSGITFIQYREKSLPRREIYFEALRLRELTRRYNATLIINDHSDIALAADADGVHLGQDDLPLSEARKIMGPRIIGISTHSLAQAREAEEGGADYIGFGPVFQTSTKDSGPPQGIDNLRLIKQNVRVPVIAIGGITVETLGSVVDAGADTVAVASAICSGDVAVNARSLVLRMGEIRKKRSGR